MPIELKNLSYTYGRKTPLEVKAVEDISLRIEDGEFVGIMGQTGCGKTTLIQLIAGLIEPVFGQVLLDQKDIHAKDYDRSILRRKVGVVFQYPEYQLFETTVEKDVAFGLKSLGLGREEIRARVKEALEKMGFSYERIRREAPMALSGGEKRRVAIAGVLAVDPQILIFDEPIAGLDASGRKNFLELAAQLNREGATILVISHDADSLCEYAKRILVLEQGKVILDGGPETVFGDMERAGAGRIGTSRVQRISAMLIQRGFPLSPHIVKYEELAGELKAVLKRGDRL